MNGQATQPNSLTKDIWISFRSLPLWVQLWTTLVLGPVNIATLFFLDEPMGGWLAFLAMASMAPNIPIMLNVRGFAKVMAVPHVPPLLILVGIILFARPSGSDSYDIFLWILLATNLVSLAFDIPDTISWIKERRAASVRQ